MGPEPPPNRLPLGAARAGPQPGCRHTTCVAGRPQRWSHPDPQVPQEPRVGQGLPTGLSVLPLRVGGWVAGWLSLKMSLRGDSPLYHQLASDENSFDSLRHQGQGNYVGYISVKRQPQKRSYKT